MKVKSGGNIMPGLPRHCNKRARKASWIKQHPAKSTEHNRQKHHWKTTKLS